MNQPGSRHLAHAFFWTFLIFAVLTQLGYADVWGHDDEWFLFYLYLLSAATMMIPFLLFSYIPRLRKQVNEKILGKFELLVCWAMMLGWMGGFGFYRLGIGYDTFVHFTASGLIAVMMVMLLILLRPAFAKEPFRLFLWVALLTLIGGTMNEVFEWAGDTYLGTSMFGEAGQPLDTYIDYVANTFGLVFGSVMAYLGREELLS